MDVLTLKTTAVLRLYFCNKRPNSSIILKIHQQILEGKTKSKAVGLWVFSVTLGGDKRACI